MECKSFEFMLADNGHICKCSTCKSNKAEAADWALTEKENNQLDHTMQTQSVYKQNGFDSRADYLNSLAEDYGDAAHILADLLGPEEDFDGLVTALEDSNDEMF